MARADKAAAVAEIVDTFNDSAGAVLTEYRGLTVKQLQELRRSLGENANYAVVKNTLAKIAAKEAGIEGFDDLLTGPTAIAFIKGDVVEAAKGLRDFAKANPALVIKGGVLDGKPPRRGGDRQAGRPRVARGAPGQAGRRDARVAQPGRLPAQRPARPGRPARRRAAGEGRAGPLDPRRWCRYAGRRRGGTGAETAATTPRLPPADEATTEEAPDEAEAEEATDEERPPRPDPGPTYHTT
jgi:large subunit ribosomal protein L10